MNTETIDVEALQLSPGSHANPDKGMCVMELASYLAHEPFSDHPKCVSPVIATFLRSWNDSLDDDTRQRLKPYAEKVIGTAANEATEAKRSWLAMDWMIRTYLPAWLDLARLTADANTLRSLPQIVASNITVTVQPLKDARKNAAATWAAARAAVWAAVWAAARDAAGDAAWDAAWDAAGDAAGDAAWAAARDAARAAVWAAARAAAGAPLLPTARMLQESAFKLLDAMIEAR